MDDQMAKLKHTLELREKQLVDIAEILAEYNQNLNDNLLKNKKLTEEVELLNKKLEIKNELILQELRDKEVIFSKLQTLERENDKLKEQLAQMKNMNTIVKISPKSNLNPKVDIQNGSIKKKIFTDKIKVDNTLYNNHIQSLPSQANNNYDDVSAYKALDENEILRRIRQNLDFDVSSTDT